MADKRISQLVDRGTIANNDVVPIVVSGATTTNKATISSIQTFMQGNLDLGVTSVGITLGSSGTDVSVSGSPITSSGNITINIPTASATNRGLLSAADWTTFNNKADAGSYVTLNTAQTITAQKTFTTSGGDDTLIVDHTSGSGIALDISKAGNGEGLRVTKTSGSGNAVTISGGNFEAGTIVKTGGTSSQFLKADGSVDSNSYALNSSLSLYLPLSGGTMTGILNVGSGNLRIAAEGASNITILRNFTGTAQGQSGFNHIGFNNSNNFYFTKNLNNGAIFSFNNTAYQTYTLPDASGTIALTSSLSGYLPLTLTSTQRIVELNGQILEVYSSANTFTSGRLIVAPTYGAIGYQTNGIFRGLQILTDGTAVLTNTGTLTMTGALNGTSASFSGGVNLATSSGNVGIGTATPTDFGSTYKVLSIDASGGGGVLDLMNTGVRTLTLAVDGGEASISSRVSGNPLIFKTNNAGTVATRLTIASTGAATFSSSVTATSGLINGTTDAFFDLNRNASGSAGRVRFQTAGTDEFEIGLKGGVAGFHITKGDATELVTVLTGGNVGIGTASPSAILDVRKPTASGDTQFNFVNSQNSSSGNTSITSSIYLGFFDDSNGLAAANKIVSGKSGDYTSAPTANSFLAFHTTSANSTTERMRITSVGYTKARANGGSYFGGGYHEFVNNSNVSGENCLAIGNPAGSNTNNTSSKHLIVADGAADRLYIYGNGNVVNVNNSFGSLSDIKLKENITDASPKLNDLLKVKVRNYNLIGEETKQIGVIAQELEEVFPAMIDESDDFEYVEVPQLDEEGNEVLNEKGEVVTTKKRVSKGTTTKSVKYSVFVPMLIKAIQELKAEIDSLKNQMQ